MTYKEFIEYNRTKPQGLYTQKHHIIPRCIDGPDIPENIIELSWLTHYYAHLLLAKENPDNKKIVENFKHMGTLEDWLKRSYKWYCGIELTEQQRQNLSTAMLGNTNSKKPHNYPKTRREPPKSEEWKKKQSEAMRRYWAKRKEKLSVSA